MSKKIGRPVMHRISRTEEYAIGSARPSFQGRLKLGFARRRQDCSPPTSTSCRRPARITAPATSARPATASRCSTSRTPCAIAACRCSPTRRRRARSAARARTSSCPAIEPMMDKAARELNVDRVAIRKHQRARDIEQDRRRPRPAHVAPSSRRRSTRPRPCSTGSRRRARSGQRNGNKVTGIGVGQGYHSAGSNGFDGLLRITPDGKLHVHTGVGNLGTYSHSATARVAAEILNYNWDNAIIERGDSRRGPALEQQPGRQPHRVDAVAHDVCRGDRHEGEADRHRRADARRHGRRLRPRRRESRQQGRRVEVDHLRAGRAEGDRARRQVHRQGGAQGHQPGHQARRRR